MSWSRDDVRKMLDEISTEHMQEALDGKMGMCSRTKKAYTFNKIMGYGIAAVAVILILGFATFNILKNKQNLQPAGWSKEDTTENENMSDEAYECYAQISVDQLQKIYEDYLYYWKSWKENGASGYIKISVLPDLSFDDDPWKNVICRVKETTCYARLSSGAAYIEQTQGAYAGAWIMDEMSWEDICKIINNKEKTIYDKQIILLWNAIDENGLLSEDDIYYYLATDDSIQVYEEDEYKIVLPVYTLYESEYNISISFSVGFNNNDDDYKGFKVTIKEKNGSKTYSLGDFKSEDEIKEFLQGLK